jgi:hypothetical protein
MEYQKPAEGILKTYDYGNTIAYSIICQCGSPDCNVDFDVEIEADDWNINLNTYFQPKTNWWNTIVDSSSSKIDNSWLWSIDCEIRRLINGLYTRIRMTYDIWTTGYLKYYQTTVMTEQQAFNYANTIIAAIDDMKDLRQQRADRK